MPDRKPSAVVRYGGAVLAIAVATLLRLWLDPVLEGTGFVIFFAAVVIASWLGGLGPSLVALALSLATMSWLFAAPPGSPPDSPARVLVGLGFFCFVAVLTALLSESMRAARRRAESLADEALRQREALRDADRRKDEFLAILAHELRNPLSPICAALDILRLPEADAATTQWAKDVIQRQVRHLVRLVDDLLDVSRITSGKIELRNETADLRTVFSRAIETARPLIDEKQHDLLLALPPSPVMLLVDPVRLAQVVGNLLMNAAKYTEPRGRIWLSGERCDNEIVIRVRDTGMGIALEMLPRVFDLFAQDPRSASGSQGGLGIGLSLVKALVELNGGRVEAHSDGVGKGTEFVVRLPHTSGEPSASQSTQGAAGRAPAPPPRRRILVVDDNAEAAGALTRLLRLEGHEVAEFHDGPAALKAAGACAPDVVFLDLGMPGMDGIETARRLRQLPRASEAMLVAVTGWGQEEDRRRTEEAGFDEHLVKPVAVEALRRLLVRQ